VLGTSIVSLMVNGLCCAFQQKDEQEQREAMRRELRTEYWHQRLLDLEMEQQQYHCRRDGSSGEQRDQVSPNSSVVSEARRRKLQRDKLRASHASSPPLVVTPASSRSSSHQTTPPRRLQAMGLPTQPIIKTASLLDQSDDDDSDPEDDARCRNNSLFDADDSQDIKGGVDEEGLRKFRWPSAGTVTEKVPGVP
jgi:hypothetical protein